MSINANLRQWWRNQLNSSGSEQQKEWKSAIIPTFKHGFAPVSGSGNRGRGKELAQQSRHYGGAR
jgi:hypothetical protein